MHIFKWIMGILSFIIITPLLIFADEAMFKIKCSKCHPLPSPLSYSNEEWNRIIDRMAVNAKLTAAEKGFILTLNTTLIPK